MGPDTDDPEMDALLESLDHAPPAITADDIMRSAERRRANWLRIAASVLIIIAAAGGAYALPGSPLPGWIGWLTARADIGPEPAQEVVPPQPGRRGAGIAYDAAHPLLMEFRSRTTGAHVRVSITTGTEIVALAPADAGRFTSEAARLIIDQLTADTFDVSVPRGATRVEIRVDGRTLFVKDGTRITAPPPAADGTYLLRLDPAR